MLILLKTVKTKNELYEYKSNKTILFDNNWFITEG